MNLLCPCDGLTFPGALTISSGLPQLPRQIGTFSSFRQAMLASARAFPALSAWKAQNQEGFALMLLEMWAYVADVQAFYDQVIANESYLQTAQRRKSIHKQVQMLGYHPKPAVAASVPLLVECEDSSTITIPPAFAVLSGSVEGHPPQIFEHGLTTKLDPSRNQWSLRTPRQQTLLPAGTGKISEFHSLLLASDASVREDDLVLVRSTQGQQANRISKIEDDKAKDGSQCKKVTFLSALKLPGNTDPADLKVYRSTQIDGLWKGDIKQLFDKYARWNGIDNLPVFKNKIVLDGINRGIAPGDTIVLSKGNTFIDYQVTGIRDLLMTFEKAKQISGPNKTSVTHPPITMLSNQLTLNKDVSTSLPQGYLKDFELPASYYNTLSGNGQWTANDAQELVLSYRWELAGTGYSETSTELSPGEPIVVESSAKHPLQDLTSQRFAIVDDNGQGHILTGSLDAKSGQLKLGQGERLEQSIALPATVYGNIITATRGETISNEALGSGDASQPNQSFALQRSPLTYIKTPEAIATRGLTSTLSIKVDQTPWHEVPSFYGAGPEDKVFIVRQDEEQISTITFGDGIRGARLPNGQNNVVASYRVGSGSLVPPAKSITQILTSVPGVRSIRNPIAGFGGADAESSSQLRNLAPLSTLLLGRAISLQDIEAVVKQQPGVRAMQVRRTWSQRQQRPVIQVWIVGNKAICQDVQKTLRRMMAPTTPIEVVLAKPSTLFLFINVSIDPSFVQTQVTSHIADVLSKPKTGLLSPEQLGVGRPIIRSQVIEAIMEVPGVVSVQRISTKNPEHLHFLHAIDGPKGMKPMESTLLPPDGQYFDISRTDLWLNGRNPA